MFPFVLVVYAFEIMGALAAPPVAPSFDFGELGSFRVGDGMDSVIGTIRTSFAVIFCVGSALWFYRYITGKGSDG